MAKNKINNKIYIGQTTRTLEQRKLCHYNTADSGNGFRFHEAIRKYGKQAFEWHIIDTATTIQELNDKERYWIEYYKSYNIGYNSTKGDGNPMNLPISKQHHDDVMRSDEVRLKISNSMKKLIAECNFFTDSHRQKISEKLKGNKHFQGHKRTPEAIELTAKGTRKKVVCYDVDTRVFSKRI